MDTVDSAEAQSLALDLRSYNEIQNLISRKTFLSGEFRAESALQLFADMDDTSWGDNSGFWIGLRSIRKVLSTWHSYLLRNPRSSTFANTKSGLPSSGDGLLGGLFQIQLLTTPIIHVSGDGVTAKAMWYAPGLSIVPSSGLEQTLITRWEWKKLAVDFILERRQWKIWHYNEFTDWATEFTTSPTDEALAPESCLTPLPPYDNPIDRYKRWSKSRVPTIYPELPVPYETFIETFSYGPQSQQ